jgi:hypothetical protein
VNVELAGFATARSLPRRFVGLRARTAGLDNAEQPKAV